MLSRKSFCAGDFCVKKNINIASAFLVMRAMARAYREDTSVFERERGLVFEGERA